jgi:hypothetical protein
MESGSGFCQKCSAGRAGNAQAQKGITASRLILAGDNSVGKAIARSLPLALFTAVCGLPLIIGGIYMATDHHVYNYSSHIFSSAAGQNIEQYLPMLIFAIGVILIILSLIVICLIAAQSKKCFVDVYKDGIQGAYITQAVDLIAQNRTPPMPFELSYDKIKSASADKTFVYIQTNTKTMLCRAFNAQKIAAAIKARLY